jgi:hypothetical protein
MKATGRHVGSLSHVAIKDIGIKSVDKPAVRMKFTIVAENSPASNTGECVESLGLVINLVSDVTACMLVSHGD